jgi:DNA repair protein RadC
MTAVAVAPACPTCAPPWAPAPPAQRPQVTSPEDAFGIVGPLLAGRDREHCLLISLDTKHRLLGVTTVSIGTVDHTFMSPREIFRAALLDGASAVFLAHNHPSGDPTPSSDDRQVTRRLAQAGVTLGVDVLDHLVVGNPEWVSLARLGVI